MSALYESNPNATYNDWKAVGKKYGVTSAIDLANAWVSAKSNKPKLALPSPNNVMVTDAQGNTTQTTENNVPKKQRNADISAPSGLSVDVSNAANTLSNLKRVIDSFVTVKDITPEEYRQGKGSVYERAWALVKTSYSNTAKHITELMAKGITTVEDIEYLTEQLNKLYEFANQSIDVNSDRTSLDKLTFNINSLATVLFSGVDSKLIDEYLKQKEESVARRGDKLLTDWDGSKSFDGRTTEYVFNAPHLQDNKPRGVNTVNNASEQVQVPPTNTALSDYVNHSGGAKGSDIAWDKIGKNYGMVKNNHYYSGDKSDNNAPSSNVKISERDFEEGAVESAKAAKRNWGYRYTRMKDSRLVRNWAQVKYSDAIYAIGKIVKAGEAIFPNQKGDIRKAEAPSVTGGTGYAVGMAIIHKKPVYVFNQEEGSYAIGWYKWDNSKNDFVKVDTPVLTKNFAGIGTREINAKGVQAIKDVYKKTQEFIDSKSVNTSSTAPQTEPTEAVTNKPTKGTTQAVEAPVSQNNDDSNAAKASINTFKEFTWARYSPNSYEVSTKGDKRFSALNARLKDGRTIEEAYQLDVKGYRQDVNGVQDTN